MKFKIGSKTVGKNFPAFIIAEAGINHNGKLQVAKQLIDAASRSDVDAIKFQTFKADDLTSSGSIYHKIFKKLELSDSDFGEISDYSRSKKIIFISTPFSNEAVDLLYKLKVPAFKIASGDLTDLPLIRYAASKKKPILLSTGMSYFPEIKMAIKEILKIKNKKIGLFHSVSSYPTPYNETNLSAIYSMKSEFDYPIGFSDNGDDLLVPQVAVSLGAKLIEKHFTLNKKMKGLDHQSSANPKQMKDLVSKIRKIEEMLGDGIKKTQKCEKEGLITIRRSIIAKRDLQKGMVLTPDLIKIARPANGIEPRFFEKIIGKKLKKNVLMDTPLKWAFLK